MTPENDSLEVLTDLTSKECAHTRRARREILPHDYDSNTVRAYMGRTRMHNFLRATGWGIPFAAYLLFVLAVLLIF